MILGLIHRAAFAEGRHTKPVWALRVEAVYWGCRGAWYLAGLFWGTARADRRVEYLR